MATSPREKVIEIEDIEQILFQTFLDDLPNELDELASHTYIEEIIEVELYEVQITKGGIFIKGEGVVEVEIQYGSGSDQENDLGFKTTDSFPFEFELTLGYDDEGKLEIIDGGKIDVDTSSFYGSPE